MSADAVMVNMFTSIAIQFLLKPRHGKSAHSLSSESTSTRYWFQTPVGSPVCETPTRTDAFADRTPATAAAIHRSIEGS